MLLKGFLLLSMFFLIFWLFISAALLWLLVALVIIARLLLARDGYIVSSALAKITLAITRIVVWCSRNTVL